jgi:hypothetical protein
MSWPPVFSRPVKYSETRLKEPASRQPVEMGVTVI